MCLLSSWAAVDRAHPLDVLEGPWGGGQCFWSHLSTCFVLTFVKEENHGRRKKEDRWRNETGFGNVSADRWWRLMELGRVPRYCQSIVFRCNGRVLVLFWQAFCQVCHIVPCICPPLRPLRGKGSCWLTSSNWFWRIQIGSKFAQSWPSLSQLMA